MKQFANMSSFKDRGVIYFKSCDFKNTAHSFYNKGNQDIGAFFEILIFEYSPEFKHEVYVRFPYSDFFIELIDKGLSRTGETQISTHENVWSKYDYDKKIKLYRQGDNLMLSVNDMSINFLTKNENFTDLDNVFSLQYLKLPEDVRSIEYCYKTKDLQYILIDYPKYDFQYNNLRFFIITLGVAHQLEILNVQRAKDGGTTWITAKDEFGNEHEFFSPTKMGMKKTPTWNNLELFDVSLDEQAKLIDLLKIQTQISPIELF